MSRPCLALQDAVALACRMTVISALPAESASVPCHTLPRIHRFCFVIFFPKSDFPILLCVHDVS